MKLFDDMTRAEKIDHIEKMFKKALVELQENHGPVYLADILDIWDYWGPWLIQDAKRRD